LPNSIKPKRGPKGRATKECRERGCHGKRHRDGYCSKHDYKHNAEYHKARARKYYPKYKETILVRSKKRYLLHKDEINKQNKIKYHSNLKKSRKASNKYYQENKAHLSAEERKRYWKEREVRCQKTANRYQKNKVKRRAQIARYQKANPEIQLKSLKKRYKIESDAFKLTADAYRYAIMMWKRVLLKRDKHTCVYCGARGKRSHLEGHHIIYKHTKIQLALVTNNGCILCRKCHDEVHRLNPIKFVRNV
jgi:5-methylcytosine-specific restriction endonuclease McrA